MRTESVPSIQTQSKSCECIGSYRTIHRKFGLRQAVTISEVSDTNQASYLASILLSTYSASCADRRDGALLDVILRQGATSWRLLISRPTFFPPLVCAHTSHKSYLSMPQTSMAEKSAE